MNIQDRVNLYKKLYTASEAPTAVKKYLDKNNYHKWGIGCFRGTERA